jgi:hypothetical protein
MRPACACFSQKLAIQWWECRSEAKLWHSAGREAAALAHALRFGAKAACQYPGTWWDVVARSRRNRRPHQIMGQHGAKWSIIGNDLLVNSSSGMYMKLAYLKCQWNIGVGNSNRRNQAFREIRIDEHHGRASWNWIWVIHKSEEMISHSIIFVYRGRSSLRGGIFKIFEIPIFRRWAAWYRRHLGIPMAARQHVLPYLYHSFSNVCFLQNSAFRQSVGLK